jgi:hypothetical protein
MRFESLKIVQVSLRIEIKFWQEKSLLNII